MSAPTPRGPRGGGSLSTGSRGARGAAVLSRGGGRGSSARGTGRGRGTAASTTAAGEGLLQKLRTGAVNRGNDTGGGGKVGRGRGNATRVQSRGRGRGSSGALSQTFGASASASSPAAHPDPRSSSPAPPSSYAGFMQDMTAKWQSLKQEREAERARAIRDGFLADPEKKRSLDKAITPVGTCTEMCPPFERVERIVQQMVDKAEKVSNDTAGRDMPSEERMVKRFRRSAAGNDEQLPSDIRTPQTLKNTLDYLFDKVVGGPERLASIHKFVWDRTRAIRNDFSIQQVTRQEDVKVAVECYERIARFHILSLHQLSNPDNLLEGENFDAHQEREQLNNTLLSLMYYYDDHRAAIPFPNEAEFRAYCIIFELQSQHPDLEDRMQSWPSQLLHDRRIQTAFKLYTAAGNTLFDQGPLRPMAPFAVAQNDSGRFWTLLASKAVPYMMACVAEIYFGHIRFAALDALWRSGKGAPPAQQSRFLDWTIGEMTNFLCFDTDEQTLEFCGAFDLHFATAPNSEQYLDFTALNASSLDKSSIPSQQVFSHGFVEEKRYRRTLVAVINGFSISHAIREGLVEAYEEHEKDQADAQDDDQSMFVQEKTLAATSSFGLPASTEPKSAFGAGLNPQAPVFTTKFGGTTTPAPSFSSKFGETTTPAPSFSSKFGESAMTPKSIFGQVPTAQTAPGFGAGQTPIFGTTPKQPSITQVGQQPQSQPQAAPQPTDRDQSQTPGTNGFSGFSFETPKAPVQSTPPSTNKIDFNFKPTPQPSVLAAKPSFAGFNFGQPAASRADPPPKTQPSGLFPSAAISSTSEAALATKPSAPLSSITSSPLGTPSQNHEPIRAPAATSASILQTPMSDKNDRPPLQTAQSVSFSAAPSSPFPFQAAQSPSTIPAASQPAEIKPFFQPPKPIKPAPFPIQRPTTSFKFPQTPDSRIGQSQAEDRPRPPQFQRPPSTSPSAPVQTPTVPSAVPESTTPPLSPTQKPQKSPFTAADKARLVRSLAQLALCQPNGLMHEYMEFLLPGLLRDTIRQHNEEVRQRTLDRLKARYLIRKYGSLWKKIAWGNYLQRRAKKRRPIMAEIIRADQEKKKRNEQELEAIMEAAQEKKRIQAEMKQAAQEAETEEKRREGGAASKRSELVQVAGTKRKSFSASVADEMNDVVTAGRSLRKHKRSRTIGSTTHTPPRPSQFSPVSTSASFRTSIFSGRSLLGRSSSSQDLRKSQQQPMQDATRTPYFRLKAFGLDGDSPVVPLTAEQVARKEKKEAEERERVASEAWNRRRTKPRPTVTPSPQEQSPVPILPPPRPVQPASTTTPTPTPDPESEDLLRQLREAREAMFSDTQWFRDQTAVMEKEIERVEQLRSSTSSNHSARVSVNGLPMANGYEYMPAPEKPGVPLSRTERRIRATGAHGLAYKPIGGKSDYAPVAMSKRGMLRYNQSLSQQPAEEEETEAKGTAKKRRRHKQVDRSYRPDPEDDEDDEDDEAGNALQVAPQKRARGLPMHQIPQPRYATAKTAASPRLHSANQFARSKATSGESRDKRQDEDEEEFIEEDDDEDDEEAEEELVEDGDDEGDATKRSLHKGRHWFDSDGVEGEADTEEYDEEDDEVLEEDEEDDEDEEESDYSDKHLHPNFRPQQQQGQYGYGREDSETPATQMSRASSAPGASADDALVLSD